MSPRRPHVPLRASARAIARVSGILLAGALVAVPAGAGAAASGPRTRLPPVADAPAPLAMPEQETGSPDTAVPPPPLEAVAIATEGPAAAREKVRTDELPLSGLMDREVIGVDKAAIGHVIDVLVDPDGQTGALLVETGGFMGVGDRRIAVAWRDVTFDEHHPGAPLVAGMTVDQVRAAPAYEAGRTVTVAMGAPPPPPAGPPPIAAAPAALAAEEPASAPPIAQPPPPLPPPSAGGRLSRVR